MARIPRVRLALFGLVMCGAQLASAAEPAKSAHAKPDLVRQALLEELDGRPENRNRLLREAIESSPENSTENAAARWQSGQIRVNHKWVGIDEIPALAAQSAKLARYLKQRSQTPDTAVGQLELANWCAKQGLPDEERAHLHRVLQVESEHAEADWAFAYSAANGSARRSRKSSRPALRRPWPG